MTALGFRSYRNFTEAYRDLCGALMSPGVIESAPRGMKIREHIGASFEIADPIDRLPYVPERDFSLSYFIAETVWYLSGRNETDWIANYSSFWRKISDDGQTANSGYGARIFRPHPRIADGKLTQWQYVIDELRNDPDSRRAVIHIRTAWDSIPEHAQLDVPCTLSIQYLLRGGKLHSVVNMRSSDIILGLVYDVPFFTFLQELLARELGVAVGSYVHNSASLHVYERHYEMCEEIAQSSLHADRPRMPVLPDASFRSPVAALDKLQEAARQTDNGNALLEMSNALDVPTYWIDWGRILLVHRAQKLKLEVHAGRLAESLAFEDYRQFER